MVGDVRGGHGLMSGLEMVSDPDAKTPLDKDRMTRMFETAYADGVMVRMSGHNFLMSPPLILTSEDVQKILSALDTGLSAIH